MRRGKVKLRGGCPTCSVVNHPLHSVYSTTQAELRDLRSVVDQLQDEAESQAQLEVESQNTLEHMMSQIQHLSGAFRTLSEVLVEEIDGVRHDFADYKRETGKKISVIARSVSELRDEDKGVDVTVTKYLLPVTDERMRKVEKEVVRLRHEIEQQKDDYRDGSSALAKDVLNLAKETSRIRGDEEITMGRSEKMERILEQLCDETGKMETSFDSRLGRLEDIIRDIKRNV